MQDPCSVYAQRFSLPTTDGGRSAALRLSTLISLGDEPADGVESSWVHFAPYGTWKGHEEGAFSLTSKVLANIVDRFNLIRNDIQIDYNHDSIKDTTGPKPAAGWIKALEVRGDGSKASDGLWGLVEWTRKAAAFIRNREYRYTSPVIDFKSKDRKTNKVVGPELFNAALTNDPFLDGQVPLTLERLPLNMEIKIKDKQEQPQQAVAADQQTADLQDEGMASSGVVDKIAEAVGMEPSAVEAAMLDRIDEIVAIIASASEGDGTPADEATASDQPAATVASDRWARAESEHKSGLEARVAVLERERRDAQKRKVDEHVSKKIEGGYIPDSSRKLATELYLEDFDRAERIYCSQIVPIGRQQSKEIKSDAQGDAKLSDYESNAVTGLVAMGYKKQVAIQKVVAQRKVN